VAETGFWKISFLWRIVEANCIVDHII
jgi:hypothetical protein